MEDNCLLTAASVLKPPRRSIILRGLLRRQVVTDLGRDVPRVRVARPVRGSFPDGADRQE